MTIYNYIYSNISARPPHHVLNSIFSRNLLKYTKSAQKNYTMSPDRPPRRIPEAIRRSFVGMQRGYYQLKDHRREAREVICNVRSDLERILIERGISDEDLIRINNVIDFAYFHHLGQYRFTGEPYITHPLKVAALVAQNPYIPDGELRDHVELALCHDLLEDTFLTEERLARVLNHQHIATGVGLLSKFIKSKGGSKKSDDEYFHELSQSGTPMARRVKIADWIHNLQTTPALTEGLDDNKSKQIKKFQSKFGETSKYILPLVRTFDESEKQYLYKTLKENYDQFKPESAPDLAPMETTA